MERELSLAKDQGGKTVSIERIGPEGKGPFFCPRCSQEVVARKGKEVAWHFAHKEGRCGQPRHRKGDGVNSTADHAPLSSFSDQAVRQDEFQPDEDKGFRDCIRCRTTTNKANMHEVAQKLYMCKECFMSTNSREIDELVSRLA